MDPFFLPSFDLGAMAAAAHAHHGASAPQLHSFFPEGSSYYTAGADQYGQAHVSPHSHQVVEGISAANSDSTGAGAHAGASTQAHEASSLAQRPTGCGWPPQTPGVIGSEPASTSQLHTFYSADTPGCKAGGLYSHHAHHTPTNTNIIGGQEGTETLQGGPQGPQDATTHQLWEARPTGCGWPPQHPGAVEASAPHTTSLHTFYGTDASHFKAGGLYTHASPAGSDSSQPLQQLAVAPTQSTVGDQKAEAARVQPSVGHFTLAGYSMLLGAMGATCEATRKVAEGKGMEGFNEWDDNFKSTSCQAADAMTPLGGLILRQHLQA